MSTLVTREERKEENWRTLKILLGIMVLLSSNLGRDDHSEASLIWRSA